MIPPLLDSHMLDVQSFCFKLIMSHNVEGAMVEHEELNPMLRIQAQLVKFH
jgi:hypothetical protein